VSQDSLERAALVTMKRPGIVLSKYGVNYISTCGPSKPIASLSPGKLSAQCLCGDEQFEHPADATLPGNAVIPLLTLRRQSNKFLPIPNCGVVTQPCDRQITRDLKTHLAIEPRIEVNQ
jgi:hypothetical protein